MINLLPHELKEGYKYARRNRHLLHWVFALVCVIMGAVAITAVGYFYLEQSSKQYEKQISLSNRQLEQQKYKETEAQVKDMSNNLTLAVQVLSKQVMFSEILEQLGSIMPKDTRLTALTISQTKGAIDIAASAKTFDAATQIRVNLSDPESKLFSKADVIGITCDYNDKTGYPCRASIRALFADQNPFLFINDKTAGDTTKRISL